MKFKNLITILVLSIMSCSAFSSQDALITINQFASHPSLEAVVKGVKTTLKKHGFMTKNNKVIIDNAQGDQTKSMQIARYQASLKPNVMIGIATPSARNNMMVLPEGAMLGFAAVTYPISAGLTGQNVLGVTDSPPIEEALGILKQVMPKAAKIGVIYNPAELQSAEMVIELEKLSENLNLKLEIATVDNPLDIGRAVDDVINKIDVLFLPRDNMVVSAVDLMVRRCMKNKIPVISCDPSLIHKKLLFAMGTDYYEQGMLLGLMLSRYLRGEEVKPLVVASKDKKLVFNDQVAKKLGIKVPLGLRLNEGRL